MSRQDLHPEGPGNHVSHSTVSRNSRLVEAVRSLRVAAVALKYGSQFAPLGDNRTLLADLAARARAARDLGA